MSLNKSFIEARKNFMIKIVKAKVFGLYWSEKMFCKLISKLWLADIDNKGF